MRDMTEVQVEGQWALKVFPTLHITCRPTPEGPQTPQTPASVNRDRSFQSKIRLLPVYSNFTPDR